MKNLRKIRQAYIIFLIAAQIFPAHSFAGLVDFTPPTDPTPPGGTTPPSSSSTLTGLSPAQVEQINTNLTNLTASVNTANGHWASTNIQLVQGNDHWQSTNTTLSEMNSSWQQTNAQLVDANAHWASTNTTLQSANDNLGSISSRLDSIKDGWNTTNQLLQNTFTVDHFLMIGAASGAGFAAGSAIANLTISTVKLAISALTEAISHERRNAKILSEVNNALVEYPKITSQANTVVRRTSLFSYVLAQIKKSNGKGLLLSELDLTIRNLDVLSEALKQLSLEKKLRFGRDISDLSEDEERHAINTFDTIGAQVDGHLRNWKQLRDEVEKVEDANLCDRMREDTSTLIQLENDLQQYRVLLLDPLHQEIWQKAWNERYQITLDYSRQLQNRADFEKLLKKRAEMAEKNFENEIEADPQLNDLMTEAFYKCLQKNGSYFADTAIRVIARLDRAASTACWKQVLDPRSELTEPYRQRLISKLIAKEEILRQIEREKAAFQDPEFPRINEELNGMALRSHYEFFSKLRDHQRPDRTEKRVEKLREIEKTYQGLCDANSKKSSSLDRRESEVDSDGDTPM